jgi:protein-L-isoaspartate(D-aspartate) O-methyltransferase
MEMMKKQDLLDSLGKKGFPNEIVKSFDNVRREDFIPEGLEHYAYEDLALPLGDGSTISQPYTIAFMLSLLELKQGQKILEIGSGSGYVLALISEAIKDGKVYGIEINKTLAIKSKKQLENYPTIQIFNRSGFSGLPDLAPFDRILISASCPDMRVPYNLLEQLKDDGILVAPIKTSIFKIKKTPEKTIKEEHPGFTFVPLREDV